MKGPEKESTWSIDCFVMYTMWVKWYQHMEARGLVADIKVVWWVQHPMTALYMSLSDPLVEPFS